MLIGSRIYELRTQKGIGREELANAVGVSRQTIARWEKFACKKHNLEHLFILTLYLNTNADYLLGLTSDPNPKNNLSNKKPSK